MRPNGIRPTTIPALTASELANLRLRAGVAQQTAEEAAANSQPLDADLTAISALTGTGLAARIADDTWALRTITSSDIIVTNGGGVAGNPTLAFNYTVSHAWTATQDFTRITSGVGEQFSPYHGDLVFDGPHTEGSILNIEIGTTAAPDTLLQTPLKVSRVMKITDADLIAIGLPVTGTGDQYSAAIAGFNKGTANCTVQVTGVYGAGINYGTTNAPEMSGARPDAAGVIGIGTTFGLGGGIGAYLEGRRYSASGYGTALELQVRNLAGAGNPVAYDPLNDASCGTWLIAGGDADLGCGHLIGHISAVQFEVGYGILGTTVSGKTGGVKVASFRDDGNATTVFDINGSHTNGLDASGATFSNHAILLDDAHTVSWGDVGLKRSSAGVLGIIDGAAGTGSLVAGNVTLDNLVGNDAALDGVLSLTNTNELTLVSADHAFTIGSPFLVNLAFDTNEIQARNAGAASQLNLNPHGGTVTIGGTALATIATSASATDITAGTLAVARGGTGVTISTGTGSVVLSASPTFTGTLAAAAGSFSGNITAAGATHQFGSAAGTGIVQVSGATANFIAKDGNSTGTSIDTHLLFRGSDDVTVASLGRNSGSALFVYENSTTQSFTIAGATMLTISTGSVAAAVPIGLPSYTVATVPVATTAGRMIYVSNEAGGAVPAFADGTNWRRVTDRAIIS